MPGIDFTHAPVWLQWVIGGIAVIGAFVAVWGFVRKLWRVNRAVVAAVDLVSGLPDRLTRIDATLAAQDLKIEDIHHETQENSGGSLKDGLKRVESQQTRMLAAQTRMERGIKGLYARADTADATATVLRKDLEDARPIQPSKKETS